MSGDSPMAGDRLREAAQDIITSFARRPDWVLYHDTEETDALRAALASEPETRETPEATADAAWEALLTEFGIRSVWGVETIRRHRPAIEAAIAHRSFGEGWDHAMKREAAIRAAAPAPEVTADAERALNRLVPLLPSTARVHDDYNIIRAVIRAAAPTPEATADAARCPVCAELHPFDVVSHVLVRHRSDAPRVLAIRAAEPPALDGDRLARAVAMAGVHVDVRDPLERAAPCESCARGVRVIAAEYARLQPDPETEL